jgi:hypothetical protein
MFTTLRTPAEVKIDFLSRPVQLEGANKRRVTKKEGPMAMTPEMDTARMERTMRDIEYEEDKPKIKRFIEEPFEDPQKPNRRCPRTGIYPSTNISRNTRIQNFCSAGTHQESELFSVPLITTVSGQDGYKG